MRLSQPKQKLPYKPVLLVTAATALVVTGAILWLRPPATSTDPASSAGQNQQQQNEPTTNNQVPEYDQQDSLDSKNNTVNQQTETPPAPNATITLATQLSPTVIGVRVLIEHTTAGQCKMVFSREGQPDMTRNIPITFQATSANCNTDINVNEFNTGGEWQLSVTAEDTSGSTSNTATQTVIITK